MAKTQTKLKQSVSESGKRTNPFQIVRDGEPLPSIARQAVRIKAPKRSRANRSRVSAEADLCPLCGGVIMRFDAEIFVSHGRCAPCHEALAESQA
jgi:hypothetical protein